MGGYVIALVILLAVVTVVGHGIWVLLAWLFGGAGRSTSASPPRPKGQPGIDWCPSCQARLRMPAAGCARCGWAADASTEARNRAALRTLRDQLDRLASFDVLDAETRARLLAAIDEQERRLIASRTAPPPTSAEAVGPPVLEVTDEPPPMTAPVVEPAPPPPPPRLGRPPAERVRAYAASREAAAAEAPAEQPLPPPRRREAVSRLLAAFLEEKNIRWGELVGGLLIVGCSIALVISFWAEIAARPLLKFVLFNGVTAALFGVGLYTDRKWKIHTTSHGLLVIATLLVPLNFLAIAAFTQDSPPTDLLSLSGEAASVVVFSLLVYLAGRIVAPGTAVLLTIGVMLPSLVQLLVRRWAGPAMPWGQQYALAAAPIACYVAGAAAVIRRHWRRTLVNGASLHEIDAYRVLTFVGIVSAATLLPLALLASKLPPILDTLHRLSPLAVWCGVPALLAGLLFWRRMTDRHTIGLQTAGVAVGVLGAAIMAGATVLAWPEPATLLPVALMNVVAFAAIAFWFGIPAALVPAGLALVGAWLVGFHLQRGTVDWTLASYEPMSSALFSVASGHSLVPLVGVFGAIAWLLRRAGRRADGQMAALVAAVTAAVSLALVLWFGFGRSGDPAGAFWTLAIYAVGTLAAALVSDWRIIAGCGWALALVALIQCVVFRYGADWAVERPWIAALLAHATIALVGWTILQWRLPGHARSLAVTRLWVLISSVAAAGLLAVVVLSTSWSTIAVYLAWLAVVWLAASLLAGWPALFTASQISVVLAIFWAVTAAVETRGWYAGAPRPWLDPWFLEAQGIALAGYCLVVAAVRAGLTRIAKPQVADRPGRAAWPAVDRVVSITLIVLVALVAIYAAAPGVAQELTPLPAARGDGPAIREVPPIERFEILGIAHAHAADRGAWLLLAAVAATLTAGLWQRGNEWRIPSLVVIVAAACPLLAARWEADVAVASALRWLVAGFFCVASIPLWFRWRSVRMAGGRPAVWQPIRDVLVAIVIAPYVVMGAYVFQAAIGRAGLTRGTDLLWPYLAGWALAAAVVAMLVPRAAKAWLIRNVLLLTAFTPLAILLAFAVAAALDQYPIVGPSAGSWFRRIGHDVSYGVPLAAIALALTGHAVHDRSSRFAFAAGLLANLVATIAVLVRIARGGGLLDATAWITVAQVNALVAGSVAMAWLAAVTWYRHAVRAKPQVEDRPGRAEGEPQGGPAAWPVLMVTQTAFAAALCGTFLLPAAAELAIHPQQLGWASAGDGVLGWAAVAIAAAAACWFHRGKALSQSGVSAFTAAVVMLLALSVPGWGTGNWPAYYTLLGGCCGAAWLVPPITRVVGRFVAAESAAIPPMIWSDVSLRCFAVVALALALRALESNPLVPWGTIAVLAAISARNVWIAWYESRRGFLWIAAVLGNLAVSIWWIDSGHLLTGTTGDGTLFELVWMNVLAASAMAIVSAALSRRVIGLQQQALLPWWQLGIHRFAAWAIVVVLLLTTSAGLAADLVGSPVSASAALAWGAWLAALATAAACWWDSATRWPVACLYSVGLVGVGLYLDGLDFRPPMFQWALANALAGYSLATSALWSVRDRLRNIFVKWGAVPNVVAKPRVEDRPWRAAGGAILWEGDGHGWLVPVNCLIGVGVLLLVAGIELTMDNFGQRMVAAYAVGAQAIALALLARGVVRSSLQYAALLYGALFAVAFGWAWVPPDFAAAWLHRAIATSAALAATLVVYGFGLVKLLRHENEWTRAAGRLIPVIAACTAAVFLLVLGMEVFMWIANEDVPIVWPARLAVALALVGLAVAALVAALVPGRDPLGLSERGRTAYVYAAEALVALLFVHIRVTMPWLFQGWFVRFWPLVVMALAFVGIGLGEVFQRRHQSVLSEPLAMTGAFLPLLPALGFWITASDVHYSLLLLSVGALYAAVSVLRKSFLFAVLAAVAANGSLWYLLYHRAGLGIAEHPQLWLIPPALCVLVAGFLNRERLSAEQSAVLRYGSAIVIYASSTADIFINGVAEAPWLPALLAGLSIAGVFAGILLRVRAFLYLGTAFLLVAIVTVIWHAAIEQERTWILWIAGIVTGVLIIALFGVFEKRRQDVLRLIERLKQWEA